LNQWTDFFTKFGINIMPLKDTLTAQNF